MKRLAAFSLAEVMIAMAVIGVVTALIIPNRITGTQSRANNVLFKSTFKQIQDGLIATANIRKQPFVNIDSEDNLDEYMKNNFQAKVLTVWQPDSGNAIKYTYNPSISGATTDNHFATIKKAYRLKNGATILFPQATIKVMEAKGCSEKTPCAAYIDVNGSNGPNAIASCLTETTSQNINAACTVQESAPNDMFPVCIKKDHIYPATNVVNLILNK